MKEIFKFFLLIIALSIFNLIPTQSVNAEGEFTSDYDVQYAISPTGITIVTQKVTLTNNLSARYPKQYTVTIDSSSIRNVIAYDEGGVIRPTITVNDGKTTVLLTFNKPKAGKGKTHIFSLRYENGDIAQKIGSIWEVNIPGVTDSKDINSYNVTAQIPDSFGPNAYLSPKPANGNQWTKEQMTHGGISAAYGTQQLFSVNLTYYLENTFDGEKTFEIPIPPDTSYQKSSVISLTPKPSTVESDQDGNRLARYVLSPHESLKVKALVSIAVSVNPKINDSSTKPIDINEYLKEQPFWEVSDPAIVALAKLYTTPRAIYEYLVSTFSYNYDRVNLEARRKGAKLALENPTDSICMEFTDTFIAIARAAGIPAREAVGYAYTTNSRLRPLSQTIDVLHTWPEYFDTDTNTWIAIDPTWARTTNGQNYFDKLDFNHITFVYHGLSSETPYPPGYYKEKGKKTKDVLVTVQNNAEPPSRSSLETTIDFPKKIYGNKKAEGFIHVKNTGSITITSLRIRERFEPFGIEKEETVQSLEPFAEEKIPIALSAPVLFKIQKGKVVVNMNGTMTSSDFTVYPPYWNLLPFGAIASAILLFLSFGLWKKK